MKSHKLLAELVVSIFAFTSCQDLIDMLNSIEFGEEVLEGTLPGEFSISTDKKVRAYSIALFYNIVSPRPMDKQQRYAVRLVTELK